VISAINIQHIESLHKEVKEITGVDVGERVPDSVLKEADEVVNIDLTADELVTRLKEGKIYAPDKIQISLKNFFQAEKILQLRELALKEVATQVERKIETELPRSAHLRSERFMACISSNHEIAAKVIRKTSRLANYYHSKWFVLYVQTAKEAGDKIGLAEQRHLINNFKLATELGAEVIRVKLNNIAKGIIQTCEEQSITTICIGKPHLNLLNIILSTAVFNQLLNKLASVEIDVVILS
jgi:two-component system sensor histidine kinase KdpD